jgi:hypothetical protein
MNIDQEHAKTEEQRTAEKQFERDYSKKEAIPSQF